MSDPEPNEQVVEMDWLLAVVVVWRWMSMLLHSTCAGGQSTRMMRSLPNAAAGPKLRASQRERLGLAELLRELQPHARIDRRQLSQGRSSSCLITTPFTYTRFSRERNTRDRSASASTLNTPTTTTIKRNNCTSNHATQPIAPQPWPASRQS